MADVVEQAEAYDLTIFQGKSFELQIKYTEDDEVTPIPLDGYTARGEIRPYPRGPLLATFSTDVVPEEGTINLSLHAPDTAKVRDRSVYDVHLESGPLTRIPILYGQVHAIPGVTR